MLYTAALCLLIAAMAPSWAPAQETRSLDDQLFDQLGKDPIDEFERELLGPDKKQQDKQPQDQAQQGPGPERESLRNRLQRELGAAAEAEDDHPLLSVARHMRQAQQLLDQKDPGPDTQRVQTQIVADLDRLIQQARKECSACKSGGKPGQASSRSGGGQPKPKQGSGGNKPSAKPASIANAKPGNGEARRPDMQQMQSLLKQLWGELPQRDRERLIQSPPEEFLPEYELLIEEYFRRLTEKQPTGGTSQP